jgi:hypothetical protein
VTNVTDGAGGRSFFTFLDPAASTPAPAATVRFLAAAAEHVSVRAAEADCSSSASAVEKVLQLR